MVSHCSKADYKGSETEKIITHRCRRKYRATTGRPRQGTGREQQALGHMPFLG